MSCAVSVVDEDVGDAEDADGGNKGVQSGQYGDADCQGRLGET